MTGSTVPFGGVGVAGLPFPPVSGATAITVGSFDGVHLGHAALIDVARAAVGHAGRVVVLAFFPHPLTTLRPDAAPPRLSTWAQRERWLLGAGADEVVRLEPAPDFLALTPERFVERIAAAHSPSAWIEGPDFRFGRGRAGGAETLRRLAGVHGFEAVIVEPIEAVLTDLTIAPASSTLTRWLVARGRVRDAAAVLGRAPALEGEVVPGEQRGREIGCATANVRPDTLVPADGVYAGRAVLPDGRRLPAAISVGTKPTFGDHPRTVEAHLLDDTGEPWDGLGIAGTPMGYGWRLELLIEDWLREQIRYDRLDDLTAQIDRDIEITRRLVLGAGALA